MRMYTNHQAQRMKCTVRGAVQGVGFRPFVYRLATDLKLHGWVANSPQGVFIEVEGEKDALDDFLLRIEREKPPRSSIQSIESSFLDPLHFTHFDILESNHEGQRTALVLPDIATCPECLSEIFNPSNRRYLYPFTNCTHCGPRYSIITSLPYDRTNTTMSNFEMCDECAREYENPLDRRFHAQPNACPSCGPHLECWIDVRKDSFGGVMEAEHHAALSKSVEHIRAGEIVALKGLGGFHLVVDAGNEDAVERLRQRKRREAKPLAVMFPSLDAIKSQCEVSELEERLLNSAESPIVLLKRTMTIENCSLNVDNSPCRTVNGQHSMFNGQRPMSNGQSEIAESVAPNNPYLGAMLPYTPLHHILMRELGFPIVATSGNLSDEPICIDEHEAVERLKGIADVFLVHNRRIVRHVDDSVVRVVLGREQVLRRARGYAPLPIRLKREAPPLLAVGAHQKNTVAVTAGCNVFMSQHIGDLETKEAYTAFVDVVSSMGNLFDVQPEIAVADMHPDYLSTQFAKRYDSNVVQIQHHFAHVASCMAENELDGQVLGVSWDGTGYGLDGTIWGGEFLLTDASSFKRVATIREFSLPGGAQAVKEPRRTALGLLYEIFGDALFDLKELAPVAAFSDSERSILRHMLSKGINAPRTTSMGRLFDAVASITNLRQRVSFEGQAAMELEFAIRDERINDSYEYLPYEYLIEPAVKGGESLLVVDWAPLIAGVIHDVISGKQISYMSQRFHNTVVEILVDVARRVGEERVILTGGCFQSRYLTARAVERLTREGFRPYWHQRVPPNDGGIALGQVFAALNALRRRTDSDEATVSVQSENVFELAN